MSCWGSDRHKQKKARDAEAPRAKGDTKMKTYTTIAMTTAILLTAACGGEVTVIEGAPGAGGASAASSTSSVTTSTSATGGAAQGGVCTPGRQPRDRESGAESDRLDEEWRAHAPAVVVGAGVKGASNATLGVTLGHGPHGSKRNLSGGSDGEV